MFYNYKILEVNNEEILYLYINSFYEFSSELDNSDKPKSIFNNITSYIKDMDIKFNGKKVMLVVNGLIIGSITLITNDFNKLDYNNVKDEYISYNENVNFRVDDNVDIIDISTEKNNIFENKLPTQNNEYRISNFVKMKNKDGKTTFVDLDNYITNYLSTIIPPTYEDAALKSAAIVARTIVFKDLYENSYLSEEKYRDTNTLKKMWKKNYKNYFNKLKSAVTDTNYQYLVNNNYYFDFDIRGKYQLPFSSYDANRLAKNGYKYIDILGHYYPDAELESA
ncbi:MAG: hypothetical protein IJO43_03515 [Bacilli bacterium]|nr:hypothetical protein [Bacilli bacterium]